jgi:guanine deaminase
LIRATIFHTPRNAFQSPDALHAYEDGGLLIRDGRILACGDFSSLAAADHNATVTDLRGGFILPGLIDTHVHFPQVRVIGSLGHSLLDWLAHCALPEERRMADTTYASCTARVFVQALLAHGTTTALVFGSHFPRATEALFEAAATAGLRIVSGLVLSDRLLHPDLHQSPDEAYSQSSNLIRRFQDHGRLMYAVTPRFALSTSEAMLEVCQTLLHENPEARFQSHLNENPEEVAEVLRAFPGAPDYLSIYERFQLTGPASVLAHDVHPTPSELERLAASGTTIAHCPASNAALGSGIFPLRKHVEAGVRCALGTDVGAGTGFGLLKEGLQAYLMQRLDSQGMLLSAAQLLYMATRAGAEGLGLDHEIGDFQPGKSADFIYLKPRPNSPLAAVVEGARDLPHILSTLFTLGDADCIEQVRIEGVPV